MADLSRLRSAVVEGDADEAREAAQAALDAGVDPCALIDQAISPAMAEVGRLFEEGDCFVPALLVSARAAKQVFELIRPLLARAGAQPKRRVVLGTVEGDLHDIGKNLVGAMLEGSGFEVIDVGVDVPSSKLIATVRGDAPDILWLSSLLSTTMPALRQVLEALAEAGLRPRVKVMVGGAPVTQAFADAIGADAYGGSAVEAAKRLVAA